MLLSILMFHMQVLKVQSLDVRAIHVGAHNIYMYEEVKSGNYRIKRLGFSYSYFIHTIILHFSLCHQKPPVASHGLAYS